MDKNSGKILKSILDDGVESFPGVPMETEEVDDQISKHIEGMCIECEDQPISGFCTECKDEFCSVCFGYLHRKGNRKGHKFLWNNINQDKKTKTSEVDHEEDMLEEEPTQSVVLSTQIQSKLGPEWFENRAKYIPVRLTLDERKLLRLVLAALNVSEYTDKVDVYAYGNKAKRMAFQLKEMCAILSGLVIANDYNRGQKLLKDRNFVENKEYFKTIFEIGRRYKIMNPEKMRGEYGKLVYMLQDSRQKHVRELLEFSCVRKIKTVFSTLKKAGALDVLKDPYLFTATQEITPEGKDRSQVKKEIKTKEAAQKYIARKYSSSNISEEEVLQCIYSIGDNHSYLRSNRDPCDRMIAYLTKYFKSDSYESTQYSLAISMGRNGARLSHSHERQYHYVLQSLTLWKEILHDMFRLWYLSEQDLLDKESSYRLCDTGQGLNRLQPCPRIGKAITSILGSVQRNVSWVGSSVIHLGDTNVPNALMFIDKYNQVSRILNPIVSTLDKIDELCKDRELKDYIESLGGVDTVKKTILVDFFRHAFDGSGADNFFDAGSCIDGRLTSAWNWCSKIEKKSYFPVFLLTGFIGFDGEF